MRLSERTLARIGIVCGVVAIILSVLSMWRGP